METVTTVTMDKGDMIIILVDILFGFVERTYIQLMIMSLLNHMMIHSDSTSSVSVLLQAKLVSIIRTILPLHITLLILMFHHLWFLLPLATYLPKLLTSTLLSRLPCILRTLTPSRGKGFITDQSMTRTMEERCSSLRMFLRANAVFLLMPLRISFFLEESWG